MSKKNIRLSSKPGIVKPRENTRLERVEGALRESEEKYRILLEHLPVGVYRTTPDGKIIEANQMLAKLLGYEDVSDLREINVSDFYVKKRDRLAHLEKLNASITYFTEFELRCRDNRTIWVRDYPRAVSGPDGKVIYYDGIIVDITERKQAEDRLQKALEELEYSNRELQQFAYVASHDLQEPLRMVASYVELLANRYKDKLDNDAEEFIAYAVEGATRMQRLINDLLEYSRVSSRGKTFMPTDCEEVINQVIANLQLAIEESSAVITHDPMPVVVADRSQLGQVFQNLVGNAIKFRAEKPPEIHIGVRQRDREWEFSVRDNGIGFEPEYAERIFMIFQRLHGRSEYPGTGIGLAICKKIIERHGGRIWVKSEQGKGSVFYFTLPAKPLSINSIKSKKEVPSR